MSASLAAAIVLQRAGLVQTRIVVALRVFLDPTNIGQVLREQIHIARPRVRSRAAPVGAAGESRESDGAAGWRAIRPEKPRRIDSLGIKPATSFHQLTASFDVLGVRPRLGRTFVAADEKSCLDEVRYLVGFLPSNNLEEPPRVTTGGTGRSSTPKTGLPVTRSRINM